MKSLRRTSTVEWIALATALLLGGCGGGGGGGGGGSGAGTAFNGGSWESDFFLEDVLFGRPLLDARGVAYQVVNPATVVEIDPITGFLLPGYPQLLFAGDTIGNLWSLHLVNTAAQPFEPKIVPRNAALLLDFSQPVDPTSLRLDGDLMLTAASPIALRDKTGKSVPAQVTVLGELVILNPAAAGAVGFPASPSNFDEGGVPVADPEGYVELELRSLGEGKDPLRSAAGLALGGRADRLGTAVHPIGMNPGNRLMDFIGFGSVTFNGFLPDLSAPRIVREIRSEGTIGAVRFAGGLVEIEDFDAAFNTTANQGKGEWCAGVLTVRPGSHSEARVRVRRNSTGTLFVDDTDPGFVYGFPTAGNAYRVQRVEYFEPVADLERLDTAVDPGLHPKDPLDPEDFENSDFFRFLSFERWTGSGWEPVESYDYDDPDRIIESDWRIGIRFSEPMDLTSFKPYDSFYVAEDIGPATDPLLKNMKLGRVTAGAGNTMVYFEPVHDDQFGVLGGDVFRGFGAVAKDLRLVVRVVPPAQTIAAFYESLGDPAYWPEGIVPDLEYEGVLGATDLGGQAPGLPAVFFDRTDPYCIVNESSPGRGAYPPAIDFRTAFATAGDPASEELDVVVHRFMGLPETAGDPLTLTTGVVYRDLDDGDDTHADQEIYGPHIADIHLGMSGALRGHSVEFIEHVFDDYNPPSPSSPSAPDPISKSPFGVGTPINASNGVRFQHIYRRGEASPDVPAFSDTILDLVGLAWAPVGGNVTSTYIKEMSIAVCLSSLEVNSMQFGLHDNPDTRESGGIPKIPGSGLKRKFDSYRGTYGDYREETPPIADSNVFDVDGDGSLRDEWTIVVGDPIDLAQLSADPPKPYADGRPYFIQQSNLFAPKNQGTQYNRFLAYPQFDNPVEHPGFGYDSTRGMLVEIRTDDNEGSPVAVTNGYAFHIAIQSSPMPRFRAYARGNTSSSPTVPAPRTAVFAATDPFDVLNPPVDGSGQPDDARSWNRGWDEMLPAPSLYGDNSRYFMIFNYAKRVSAITSPWVRTKPSALPPVYLPPIIEPPLDELPIGTALTVRFRAAATQSGAGATGWVAPEEIGLLNGGDRPYIQFRATFEANLATGEVPAIDSIVIPYLK